MRLLTDAMRAAQQQPSARPYVSATFSDVHGDTTRIRYQRRYTGSEGEYYVAAAMAGDGSLIRARIDPATKVLYTQRVANPGPGSTFTAWTSHGTVSASGAVALCADSTFVWLFYVDTDTLTLRVKQSSDNGATYGSATTVATAVSAVTYLAAAPGLFMSVGQIVLFWTVGAVIWRSRYAGGAWGAAAAWTNSVTSLTGIACAYGADWGLVICGTAATTADAKVWTCVYGDGSGQPVNVWGPLLELQTASAGSSVTFLSPALVLAQHWRLFFVEKYTGTQSYRRLQWSVMNVFEPFEASIWREPAPFDYTGDYGVAAAYGPATLWLAAAAGVWTGSFASPFSLEVSDDVVEAEIVVDETSGSARLVLRNDATSGQTGRYAGYGSGALANLRRGARLELSPGYYTSNGPEASTGDAFWVETFEQTTGADARLIVHARDAWWQLERWRARRQYVWAAGTTNVHSILAFVCSRAGLSFAASLPSVPLLNLYPAFTIGPGENGKTAVLRLAAMVPDRLLMRGSILCSRQVSPSDAADYAYGTSHAIASARYVEHGPGVNRARVVGVGVYNEGFDFADIEAVGERIAQLTDRNLTTAADAADRASLALRTATLATRRDELRLATVNAVQEVLDVVEVTDAQAGLAAAKRRVHAISWRYTCVGRKPRYEMTLTLGEP
jgi:hypothetical protein